ncbi:usg protein [Polymorphum gilvum]|uniref:Phosphoribosylanthranilate isomerase subunit n=1 Tax=Polymorphum gilvum (strain LMG 25793 / CGMCC 1.9160 / SL003B-26A1) TaxID=991905 RepID=F2J4Z2_POLGS|nr:usg protein [Polymorphum gilvum]ADZ70034.1 phosphoribosylanthranilate isomerase subunit [Polymorphum gilvum SL003B-26A1]
MRTSEDFRRQIDGYGLLTAEILYRMPDHPGLLQSFLWQTHDRAPTFPELRKFLAYWQREIEGVLHSVRLAHRDLIGPVDVRIANGEIRIH